MTTQMQALAFKTRVKRILQKQLPTKLPPFIVASMGRSGSTLVWDALRRSMATSRFPSFLQAQGQRLVSDQVWDMEGKRFAPGVVYKTHDLAQELSTNSGARVIFLFGSAADTLIEMMPTIRVLQ